MFLSNKSQFNSVCDQEKIQYDIINLEKLEAQAASDAAVKSAMDVRKDPDFIDFTMPPPKKITLPKVQIEKPDGPLPFQVNSQPLTHFSN